MNKKAFTLVGLMVVIAIIAILAVGSVTGYNTYIAKATDSTTTQNLKKIDTIIQTYYANNGRYPNADGSDTDPSHILQVIRDFNS